MSRARKAQWCLVALLAITVPLLLDRAREPGEGTAPVPRTRILGVRIGVETLRNPYWYEEHGHREEAKQFWDKRHWDRALRGWAAEGYTHVLYWVEPWNQHAW